MKSTEVAVGETEIPLLCMVREGLSLSKPTEEHQAHNQIGLWRPGVLIRVSGMVL